MRASDGGTTGELGGASAGTSLVRCQPVGGRLHSSGPGVVEAGSRWPPPCLSKTNSARRCLPLFEGGSRGAQGLGAGRMNELRIRPAVLRPGRGSGPCWQSECLRLGLGDGQRLDPFGSCCARLHRRSSSLRGRCLRLGTRQLHRLAEINGLVRLTGAGFLHRTPASAPSSSRRARHTVAALARNGLQRRSRTCSSECRLGSTQCALRAWVHATSGAAMLRCWRSGSEWAPPPGASACGAVHPAGNSR